MYWLKLLRHAVEVDHEGPLLDRWKWQIVKVKHWEWYSNSSCHSVETNIPPFFRSMRYSYFVVKPVFCLVQRDLLIGDDVFFDVCDYPIPEKLVYGLSKTLNLGYFMWYVSRGVSMVSFCKYIETWSEKMDEIFIDMVVEELQT